MLERLCVNVGNVNILEMSILIYQRPLPVEIVPIGTLSTLKGRVKES